jgi:type VI secretion system protein VasI
MKVSKILVAVMISLLTFSTNTMASMSVYLEKSLNACAYLFDNDKTKKLECENNARTLDKIKTKRAKTEGHWELKNSINPMDDSSTVTLRLKATTGESARGKSIWLYIRCQSNKTDLFVQWGDYLGSDVFVTSRVGKQKSVTNEWNISTNSKSAFVPNPIPFIKNMMKSNKFVAQVTPYNENPVTATFYTTKLETVIKPLRNECHW